MGLYGTMDNSFYMMELNCSAEVSAGADNLHLSRYLRFFSFTSDICQTSAPFAKSVNLK